MSQKQSRSLSPPPNTMQDFSTCHIFLSCETVPMIKKRCIQTLFNSSNPPKQWNDCCFSIIMFFIFHDRNNSMYTPFIETMSTLIIKKSPTPYLNQNRETVHSQRYVGSKLLGVIRRNYITYIGITQEPFLPLCLW